MSLHATVQKSTRRIPTSVGGFAALAGGFLLVASSSLEAAAGLAKPGSLGFVAILTLLTVSSGLLITAALGAQSYLRKRTGRAAQWGLITVVFAHLLLAIGAATPLITREATSWTTPSGYVRLAGVLIAVVGVTMLSTALWRTSTVRTAAVTWLWTVPLLALFVGVGGLVQNAVGVDLLWIFLGVQLGAGWLILGYRLLLVSDVPTPAAIEPPTRKA